MEMRYKLNNCKNVEKIAKFDLLNGKYQELKINI